MTQVIMGWLYPMLASAYLVLAILLGLTWWVKDRLLVILLLAISICCVRGLWHRGW